MTERTIRMTAKDLCGAFYEDASLSERFRAFWPDQNVFIARNWLNFVEPARRVLSSMLGRKDISEREKEAIYKALVEDNRRALRAKPQPRAQFMLNPEHPGKIERKVFHDG